MNAGLGPTFSGSTFIDSPAAFHGHAASRKWQTKATIDYAKSMNQNKFSSAPSYNASKPDVEFMASQYATKNWH